MSTPTRSEIKAVGVVEVVHALEKIPEAWPIVQGALLALLDKLIAIVPGTLKPGLQNFRDLLAAATEMPPGLVDDVLNAIKGALLSMQFGPATSDDADTA